MVENINKLEAAFLAGRMDAMAEQRQTLPEGLEDLLHMVLSDSDCGALTRLSKVLFHRTAAAGVRLMSSVKLLPVGSHNGGPHNGKSEAS
ncbi:MAG TPA: hypothetical protein VMD08_06880 [Candidatus Baltobacteraceae bacterium]|nr:hypothetical protein [Candidatus Baltobacteraceae bacterium]